MNIKDTLEELQMLREIIGNLEHIMTNSCGVSGWHLNGDVAYWGEFDLQNSVDTYYKYYGKEGE